MIYSFDYLMVPMAAPRPRVTKTGHAYMPKEYTAWKRQFAQSTAIQLANIDNFKTIDYPIYVKVEFVFPRPQRMQHREIPSHQLPHASKPDIDNLIKAVLDGLKDAQVFTDDNLVASIHARKAYCSKMSDGTYEYSHISVTIS